MVTRSKTNIVFSHRLWHCVVFTYPGGDTDDDGHLGRAVGEGLDGVYNGVVAVHAHGRQCQTRGMQTHLQTQTPLKTNNAPYTAVSH